MGEQGDRAPQSDPSAHELAARLAEELADVVYAMQVQPTVAFTYLSSSVERLTGYSPQELLANPALAVDSTQPDYQEAMHAAFASPVGAEFDITVPWVRKDGRVIWTHHRCRKLAHPDGSQVVYAAARDVTAQVEAERALASSEGHYRMLAENSSDVVFRTSVDAVVEWTSPSTPAVLGWDPADMLGRPIAQFLHPDDREAVRRAGEDAAGGERVSFEARYATKDGGYRWLQVTARPIVDADGVVIGKVGSGRVVDAEVEARQQAERSQRMFRLAMESAPSGMAVVDLDRRVVEANPALAAMLGYEPSWLLAYRVPDLLHPDDDDLDIAMRAEVLSGRSSSVMREVRLRMSDGEIIWVQHGIGLLRDEDGTPLSYVSQFVDITDARHARQELEHLASHDGLTGLSNRRQLLEWMDPILSHRSRAHTHLAVLYLDVDGLKPVNDRFGHHAGDAVIVEVARRIRQHVREDDMAARIGGDEFVVALPAVTDINDAMVVATKLRQAIDEPYRVDGHLIDVTVSIGVAMAEPGSVAARALQQADLALYRAKEGGRDRIEVFDSSMDARRA